MEKVENIQITLKNYNIRRIILLTDTCYHKAVVNIAQFRHKRAKTTEWNVQD